MSDEENKFDSIKFSNHYNWVSEFKNVEDNKRKWKRIDVGHKVMLDEEGRSRRFGFVAFENPQSAVSAVIGLNGKSLGDNKFLYVARALNKIERQQEINRKLEERKRQKAGQVFYY
ncbi:unnamed protein product [Ceratitis capitata]|uniref:(Mediterranean fruit fly) hypothetical protein n=1 Tax=Ceratitis capitata TaxID=7213 RepID=A0A811VKD9_CERCA|nr:unnamed protein product [Ceratitis capitata]